MPRDKTESHERLLEAAKNEFMEYGFTDASMRRIAENAGITVSGVYKHFKDKEEMFAALVQDDLEYLMTQYNSFQNDEYEDAEVVPSDELWENSNEVEWIIDYIYEHYDTFKLIICKSQGTRYENFAEEIIEEEEKATYKFFEILNKRGLVAKKIPEREIHLLVTCSVNAIFETVIHDFTKAEAKAYSKNMDKFFKGGWKSLMGL